VIGTPPEIALQMAAMTLPHVLNRAAIIVGPLADAQAQGRPHLSDRVGALRLAAAQQ
jgi:hypothetical protein